MSARVDVLDQHESLRSPLILSIMAHVALFGILIGYSAIEGRGGILWGTPHAVGIGGTVAISPVRQIPLPVRSGQTNPLANDTESQVPAPPKPQPKKAAPAPDPKAVEIPTRKSTASKPKSRASSSQYRAVTPERPNQLYSSTGQALSSPLFGSQTGTGGVGVGPGSAFGQRYGWYRDLLETRVAQKWRTEEVDATIRTAPPVIVTFEILRDGRLRNVSVVQSSGNLALDNSARRAVFDASPFPPLPAGFDSNTARIEFWFVLKR